MDSNYRDDATIDEHDLPHGLVHESTTLLAKPLIATPEGDQFVIAGWGACKSCSCSGFIRKSGDICGNPDCGHHFNQHK